MKLRSLSLGLALWVGVLGLLQAAAVLALSYVTLSGELDAQQRAVLHDKADHAMRLVRAFAGAEALKLNAAQFVELVNGHPELHMVVSRSGAREPVLAFSTEARESLERLKSDTWGADAFLEWRTGRDLRPMLSIATWAQTGNGESYEVVLSADRSADQRLLTRLLLTSGTAAPFALALVSLSALFIVKLGLRPLNRFSRAAARISTQDLATRIDPAQLPAELQSLCSAFNAMLDRLDQGVRRLSEFSSDLAHEMRTPLATLLGRTQVALSQERSTEELIVVLEGNVEELERLSRLVADMLFLSRADDARAALDRVELDLAEEAHRVADFLEPLGQEREMTISVTGSGLVRADRQLVRRAITNLLSNALRHGETRSTVGVRAGRRDNGICLEVMNRGTPIAPEHHARLFDRFYRMDTSRARDSGGSGLGLAIVKTIMQLHGGTVHVESDAESGTRFILCFPMASS